MSGFPPNPAPPGFLTNRLRPMKPLRPVFLLPALCLAGCATAPSPPVAGDTSAAGFARWTPLIEGVPPGADPAHLITVGDGGVHMYADIPAGAKVAFGNLLSYREFSRFHLRLEYSWGTGKFAPRTDKIRDAGLLYHIADSTKLWGAWPHAMEFQIQEGDVGDLVFIKTGALTWMNPDPQNAPAGQGDPGLLPEMGGVPQACTFSKGFYIGRYPEYDRLEGWNTIEAIVQADEGAVHKVNGRVRSRTFQIVDNEGHPLRSGKLAVQLEGAEILYRNLEIRELPKPLQTATNYVSLSSVKDKGDGLSHFTVTNPGPGPIPMTINVTGADADSFLIVTDREAVLAPGERATVQVVFKPHGPARRHSAGLQVGPEDTGRFLVLQGLALDAFEGSNEPTLERIVQALGLPLNVGGSELHLDTAAPKIGDGVDAISFRQAGPGPVRLTPLARFSPPGAYPVGWYPAAGGAEKVVATLVDSSVQQDAHQRLFPSFEKNAVSATFDPSGVPFGLFVSLGKETVAQDPARHPRPVARPARVYPLHSFQGKRIENAALLCFEEASNGDYQDAVFLLENVVPVVR